MRGYSARLTLLTALSHSVPQEPYEADTNGSILWIRKEGLNLRKVTPGLGRAGEPV